MSIAAYVRGSSKGQKDVSQQSEIEKWLDANGFVHKQVQCLVSPLGQPLQDALALVVRARTVLNWGLGRCLLVNHVGYNDRS
jgi:hypothetical protein